MSKRSLLTILLALCLFSAAIAANERTTTGKKWGVIVAGAQGYNNYFSQSNACHGYHVLRNGGIPEENIIHMNYDDVASCTQNPVKNNLANTLHGENVHEGCVIDYRGEDVQPEVFLHVLTGNKTGVQMVTGKMGKVLQSGPDDEVFLYMTDHGGKEIFYFPTKKLHAKDFANALNEMHQRKMYNQMVIYMDSCYSGSMFDGLLPDNVNMYAATSANPQELAWLNCFDSSRGAFLSTVFSHSWMYTTDQLDRDQETFHQLYVKAYNACTSSQAVSHPQQYGNVSFSKYLIDRFMGYDKGTYNKNYSCDDSLLWDRTPLKSLTKEFDFPFEEDVLSPEFLQRPPIDMGGVATLIRRLLANTATQKDRVSLKAELNYSSKVKVVAQQLIKSVVENVTGSGQEASSHDRLKNADRTRDCYYQTVERVLEECPVLQPHRFPFVNRNLMSLMNLCEKVGTEIILDAISTSSCPLSGCKMPELTQ